jgi:hypothetical protein
MTIAESAGSRKTGRGLERGAIESGGIFYLITNGPGVSPLGRAAL